MVAMAAASNTLVVPHCSGVFSFHLVGTALAAFYCRVWAPSSAPIVPAQVLSSPNCPMSEYPALNPVAEAADTGLFGGLFEGEPLPSDGARGHKFDGL